MRFIMCMLGQQKYMIELTLQHSHHHEGTQHKHQQDDSSSLDQSYSHKQLPCHPRRPAATFDFSAIQEQIKIIRRKKQQAKQLARRAKKVEKTKNEVYEADIIQEQLEQSMDLVPGFLSLAIKQRIKFIEDKVYISAQNQNFGELVSRIKQQAISNEALGNELNLMMSQIQVSIQNDIDEGQYEIHNVEHKKKIIPIEAEPAHRVKLKNMLIKNKILDLKEEFNRSQMLSENVASSSVDGSRVGMNPKNIERYVNRNQSEVWGDQFHLLSEGTKKAQEFIKRIQEQQKRARLDKSKKQREMKSLQVKSAMEHKQFQEQMRREKHQSLKKRYEEGRMQKMTEKEQQQQREKEYINFLKEYRGKKPLFKKKEEEFQQKVIQQQERRRKAQLQEIHKVKRPITLEELEQHQRNYQKLKGQKQVRLNQERSLRKKQMQNLPKRSFYRGKFHSLILQQQEQAKYIVDPHIAKETLLKKQKEFGEIVRKKYSPMISEAKRKQLQDMIKVINSEKARKGLTQQQYKQLGNNYLKQLKAMMAELKAKGLVKLNSPLPEVVKKKNYLQEVREKYNFSTIDYTTQVNSNEQWVVSKALKLQKDAKHKQKILRYKSQQEFDFEYYMKQLQSIHDNYINSAEAKMSLINKLQGRRKQRSQQQISDQKSSIT